MRVNGRIRGWDFWVGLTVLSLALIGLALVPSQVLEPRFGARSVAFSPKMFPNLTLSVMALLGAVMVLSALLGRDAGAMRLPAGSMHPRVLAPMLIMLAYVLLLETLGTFLATALAVGSLAYVLGNRHWFTILSLALLVPTFIWLVFGMGLRVFLPEGTLFAGFP